MDRHQLKWTRTCKQLAVVINHESLIHVAIFFPFSSWFIDNQTDIVTYLISGANLTAEDNNVTFTYSYEPCPPGGCPPPGIDYGPYESR